MKLTNEQFSELVANSVSYRQILDEMKLVPAGGNYATVKRRINSLKLDCSHFTGQGYLKGRSHNWAKSTPLDEILVENSAYGGGSYKLKNKLVNAGIFEQKCYKCQNTHWMGQSIPLELEHKNGSNTDNRIENLTLLCPNCHALTDTYRDKNKKRG